MIKPDHWIVEMARRGMIEPFQEGLVSRNAVSSGVSSYGYDFRVDRTFKLFRGTSPIDPKQADPSAFEDFEGDVCLIPPNSFALAKSVEYFRIPRNVLTICAGKSTYARCGLVVNVTPFEPEWEGHVTLSISNTAPVPVRVYAGEGIAQVLFFEAAEVCRTSYRERKGKYQAQAGIVLAKVMDEGEQGSGPVGREPGQIGGVK